MHNNEPRHHTYEYPYSLTEPPTNTPASGEQRPEHEPARHQPAHGRTGRWLHRREGRIADLVRTVTKFVRDTAKGRGSFIGVGAAALAAVFLIASANAVMGVSAAPVIPVTDTDPSAAAADRADAAQRADRGHRPPPPGTPGAPSPTKPPAPKPAPAWVNPMPDVPMSSCYGPRWGTMHQGIDFAGDAGTKILSVGAGTVIAAGWVYTGYGISIVVDHGNGFQSHYAHASETLVDVGQAVRPGQALALEGSTGDSTGPHLHFEIHQGMWNQVDPGPWLRSHGVPVDC